MPLLKGDPSGGTVGGPKRRVRLTAGRGFLGTGYAHFRRFEAQGGGKWLFGEKGGKKWGCGRNAGI